MSRFTVILPEGAVILRNEETGATLRLSADEGPLVLGEIDMAMTWSPKPYSSAQKPSMPASVASAPTAPAAKVEEKGQMTASDIDRLFAEVMAEIQAEEAATAQAGKGACGDGAPDAGSVTNLKPNRQTTLRAIPAQDEIVFTNPYEGLKPAMPTLPPGFGPNQGEPFLSPDETLDPMSVVMRGIRVLDAPMEALVAEDFERTLEALARSRNNLEGEIEYLEEIEAEEDDIDELVEELNRLDRDIGDVIARKTAWEAIPKKNGV